MEKLPENVVKFPVKNPRGHKIDALFNQAKKSPVKEPKLSEVLKTYEKELKEHFKTGNVTSFIGIITHKDGSLSLFNNQMDNPIQALGSVRLLENHIMSGFGFNGIGYGDFELEFDPEDDA